MAEGMIHYTARLFETIAALGAFSGMGYYALCLWSAGKFLREKRTARQVAGESSAPTQAVTDEACAEPSRGDAQPPFTPPVSILKPLKGTDPEIYQSFRSHCLQSYPEYEIIFGVSDPNDPVVELVERLKQEFPERTIQLVVCHEILGTNTKVSNLVQMLPAARHEYLIVNDSDIRVGPDYVRRVVAPLADARVGLVTCLYRGIAGPTLGSRLESVGISTDFSAGVLAARQVEDGIRFGLGSTLAFRARDLQAIGGFEVCADYLADDYEIGKRIAALGLEVALSEVVVDTFLPPYTLREFVDHQLRWARSVRDARRWGYVGILLTFGLPWVLLTLALAHGARWVWELFVMVATARLVMAFVVGRVVLEDRQLTRLFWLVPLRDIVALLVWISSFAGHRVAWRGDSFTLKDGKLARISP